MNILVIDDDRSKYRPVFETFEEDPVNAFFFCEPPETQDEQYLSELMNIVKGEGIEAILSLSYYRFISLACGVLGIPYLCWLIKGYEVTSFDKTIINQWNHVFCADYYIYDVLKRAGAGYLKFLPLSFKPYADEAHKPCKDILLVTDNILKMHSSIELFDLLKDSSKGYIDGVLNAQKCDLRDKALFDNAAVYFREDMKENYPMETDDLEPTGFRYDNRLFYPVLENTVQHIMLFHITASWIKRDYTVDVITQSSEPEKIENSRVHYFNREDFSGTNGIDYNDYKLIIYFPTYKEKNMVTGEMLNIMASKSLLLLPGYVNDNVLDDTKALFFRNRYELTKLIDKYLFDEEARAEAVKNGNAYAKGVPTYKEALNEILSEVSNQ